MSSLESTSALVGRIPVRNLWLLMLYASRLYREIPATRRYSVEENPDEIPDLVAEILSHAVERRLRRNLSYDFQRRNADLTRVRGKIDLLRTERRQFLQRGKVACFFDELTTDTPLNRFVKAALKELPKTLKDPELARRCRSAAASLDRAGVNNVSFSIRGPAHEAFPAATTRINFEDRQMLAAAQLAFSLAMPTEDPGRLHLPAPDRDDIWARKLFEAAVGGFYDTVLTPLGWRIREGGRICWQVSLSTPGISDILPSMKTDIILEQPAFPHRPYRHQTIIDTKFTQILGAGRYRDHTLRSGYIYQIYAYLRSQEREDNPQTLCASGLLLHPSVNLEVDEAATIQGHHNRFATVGLSANSRTIRNRLLELSDTGSPVSRQL